MLGVAFEGCACRGAFHAGVAAALAEAGLAVAVTAGASSGSLSAVGLAAGLGAEMPRAWAALAGRSVVSWRRLAWNRSIFDMSHLVRDAITVALGPVDLRTRPVEALVVATSARTLARRVFSSHAEPSMVEPVMGSCFLPVLYGRPVRVGRELLLDGGLTDNLPVELLAERGADEIVAVVPSPEGLSFKSPRRRRWRPEVTGVRVHVVHPRRALDLGSWDFHPDRLARAIEEGFARGRELQP
jgi:NTE family protein